MKGYSSGIIKAKNENNCSSNSIKHLLPKQPIQFSVEMMLNQKKDLTNYNSLNYSKSNAYSQKYQQFDSQNNTYTLMIDFSHLKIRKEEKFMERMKFDVYKRQIKEEKVNELVDINKLRISENERHKGFNRLIRDANRRIEARII